MDSTAPNGATATNRSTLNPLAPIWTPAESTTSQPLLSTALSLIPIPILTNGILPAGNTQTPVFGTIGEPVPRLTHSVPFGDQFALIDFVRLHLSGQDPEVTPPTPSTLYTPFRRSGPQDTSAFESESGENIFENQHWHIRNASAPRRLTSGVVERSEAPEARRRLSEAIRETEVARFFGSRGWNSRDASAGFITNGILENSEAPAPTLFQEANEAAEVEALTVRGVQSEIPTAAAEEERDPVELEIEQHPLLNCRQN